MGREIIEFTNTQSEESNRAAPIIENYLKNHPQVCYTRIDEDVEPELRSVLLKSQGAIVHPCFVSFENGKFVKAHSGEITEEDLDYLAN